MAHVFAVSGTGTKKMGQMLSKNCLASSLVEFISNLMPCVLSTTFLEPSQKTQFFCSDFSARKLLWETASLNTLGKRLG